MSTVRRRLTIERSRQAGVGLIEVLVALLVLSIGMLGLAGLQLWSVRNNQGAMERSMAVVETHSIVDAMRADRATALAGGFNVAIGGRVPSGDTFATRSLTAWRTTLSNMLGTGADGAVDCRNTGVCTIRVVWSDQRSAENTVGSTSTPTQEIATQVRL